MSHPLLASLSLLVLFAPVLADDCVPTPHRTTGTHYEPVTVQKTDIGKGVTVRGQVLGAPECKPLAHARVAHWQAGEDGRYSSRLRAYLFSDAEGRFKFETEWPKLHPAHIHFIVTAEGYDTLETQWIGDERQTDIDFTMVLKKKQSH
jgi:protocatechuate 3,4-dioxygenase beta subunit